MASFYGGVEVYPEIGEVWWDRSVVCDGEGPGSPPRQLKGEPYQWCKTDALKVLGEAYGDLAWVAYQACRNRAYGDRNHNGLGDTEPHAWSVQDSVSVAAHAAAERGYDFARHASNGPAFVRTVVLNALDDYRHGQEKCGASESIRADFDLRKYAQKGAQCPECNGKGQTYETAGSARYWLHCEACDGTGTLSKRRWVRPYRTKFVSEGANSSYHPEPSEPVTVLNRPDLRAPQDPRYRALENPEDLCNGTADFEAERLDWFRRFLGAGLSEIPRQDPRRMRAWWLYHVTDWSYGQIAEAMDSTETTVKRWVSETQKAAKGIFHGRHHEPGKVTLHSSAEGYGGSWPIRWADHDQRTPC
jgi:hypothetical protein